MSKESAMAMATGNPAPAAPAAPVEGLNAATNQPPATPNTSDPRMQALLKKEVSLVNERSAFNKQKQEWEQKSKTADEILGKAKSFEETLAKDPVAALRLIGFSETQIFNVMAAAQEPAKVKTPEEIAAETTQKMLKERDETDAKRNAEMQAKANDAAITTSIKSILTDPANAEKFEYCAYLGEIAQDNIRKTLFALADQAQAEAKGRGEQFIVDEPMAQKLLMEAVEATEKWYFDADTAMQAKIKKRRAITGETTAEATAVVVAQEENKTPPATNPVPNTTQERRASTLTNRVSATSAAMAAQRESKEQKRQRLEQILATGDTKLLRN